MNYRDCHIHPAERCVACYTQDYTQDGGRRSSAGSTHMTIEGRKPSSRLSACKSAVVVDSRRRKIRPHYEVEADDCRVVRASSRVATGETEEFPFFHKKARQPKEVRTEGKQNCMRVHIIACCFPR